MRIVSISHYYTPHVGGLEIVAENQVVSLVKSGHEITVITCAGLGEKPGTEVAKGATLHRSKAINIFDKYFSIPFPIVGTKFIWKAFDSIRKSDIVHVHDVFYTSSWVALAFAFMFKKPLILTQHVSIVPHTSKLVMWIQRIVYAVFGKLLFLYSEKIVVYNPQVRDFLLAKNVPKSKILVTHNGIETEKFLRKTDFNREKCLMDFGLPVDRKLVLFVGRFVPKKGYDILFQAKDNSFDLVYVGSGEVPKIWLQEEHFHFLGPRSQSELAQLYQVVDLFVFPAEGEMFTLVMQEAMASGLPVIASDESGYLEYDINRNLMLLCERSPEAFKANILKVLADKDLSEAMSKYSVHLSGAYFNWDKNFAKVLDVYRILEGKYVVTGEHL